MCWLGEGVWVGGWFRPRRPRHPPLLVSAFWVSADTPLNSPSVGGGFALRSRQVARRIMSNSDGQSVKATFRDGVLEPLESLDLEDGDVVTLSISVVGGVEDGESASVDGNGVDASASVDPEGQEPTDVPALLDRIKRISDSVPDSEWEKLPKDGARNKKHYLYGHPKEDEG